MTRLFFIIFITCFFHEEKNHVYLLYTAIDKLLANNLLKQLNGAASGPISQRRGFCHNQHAKQNKNSYCLKRKLESSPFSMVSPTRNPEDKIRNQFIFCSVISLNEFSFLEHHLPHFFGKLIWNRRHKEDRRQSLSYKCKWQKMINPLSRSVAGRGFGGWEILTYIDLTDLGCGFSLFRP